MFDISIVYFEPTIDNCTKSSAYFKARNFRTLKLLQKKTFGKLKE